MSHGRCDSSTCVKLEKMGAVNSSTKQLGNLVMNFPSKLAPRQNDAEEKGRKNLWHQKQTPNSHQNIRIRIPFLNFHPSEIPFSPSDHFPEGAARSGTEAFDDDRPSRTAFLTFLLHLHLMYLSQRFVCLMICIKIVVPSFLQPFQAASSQPCLQGSILFLSLTELFPISWTNKAWANFSKSRSHWVNETIATMP